MGNLISGFRSLQIIRLELDQTKLNTTELVVEIRPEKNQVRTGFELMTCAIPVKRSTNRADKPTGSWSLCWIQINLPCDEY